MFRTCPTMDKYVSRSNPVISWHRFASQTISSWQSLRIFSSFSFAGFFRRFRSSVAHRRRLKLSRELQSSPPRTTQNVRRRNLDIVISPMFSPPPSEQEPVELWERLPPRNEGDGNDLSDEIDIVNRPPSTPSTPEPSSCELTDESLIRTSQMDASSTDESDGEAHGASAGRASEKRRRGDVGRSDRT